MIITSSSAPGAAAFHKPLVVAAGRIRKAAVNFDHILVCGIGRSSAARMEIIP